MDALAEWARHESLESEKAFRNDHNWNNFKQYLQKHRLKDLLLLPILYTKCQMM